jgi:hypothetical protein
MDLLASQILGSDAKTCLKEIPSFPVQSVLFEGKAQDRYRIECLMVLHTCNFYIKKFTVVRKLIHADLHC